MLKRQICISLRLVHKCFRIQQICVHYRKTNVAHNRCQARNEIHKNKIHNFSAKPLDSQELFRLLTRVLSFRLLNSWKENFPLNSGFRRTYAKLFATF